MRFFLPTICTHGPGEDPFEAVMCAGGAASQISCCLLKILFLIQNNTWISAGFQQKQLMFAILLNRKVTKDDFFCLMRCSL